jgi:hypothetical protein
MKISSLESHPKFAENNAQTVCVQKAEAPIRVKKVTFSSKTKVFFFETCQKT